MSFDDDLKKLLAGITPRERDVLRRKFGITLSDNPTAEEIRALTSISRERIEEIEEKALKKLWWRSNPDGKK